jgi:hypothetical protein
LVQTADRSIYEREIAWRSFDRSTACVIVLVCFQTSAALSLASVQTSSIPAWDRLIMASACWWGSMGLTALGAISGIVFLFGKTAVRRAAGIAACACSFVTSPFNTEWLTNRFRSSEEVTLDNWRQHRVLRQAAAVADEVDHHPEDFIVEKRRFRCDDTNLVRFKLSKTDDEGRVRSYVEGTEGLTNESVARYFDADGVLRFVLDQASEQRTFLDEAGEPLWAWRHGQYGLHALQPSHLSPHSAAEARARWSATDPGCEQL